MDYHPEKQSTRTYPELKIKSLDCTITKSNNQLISTTKASVENKKLKSEPNTEDIKDEITTQITRRSNASQVEKSCLGPYSGDIED